MVATVHAPPEGIRVPEAGYWLDAGGRFSAREKAAADEAFIAACRAWLAASGYTGELAGAHVRWPQGDGYARYLVMKIRPLWLMHLPLGDPWHLDDIRLRGLRPADITENIEMQARLAAVYGHPEEL